MATHGTYIKKEMPVLTCVICEKTYVARSHNQKICGAECKKEFWGRRGTLDISTASVGAIAEMAICVEMLSRGYSVFRSVSASGFCDVVAIKGDERMLLEVRTGYEDFGGKIQFPRTLHDKIARPTHYAVYVPRTKNIFFEEIL